MTKIPHSQVYEHFRGDKNQAMPYKMQKAINAGLFKDGEGLDWSTPRLDMVMVL